LNTQTRRQREFEQRERLFLDAARAIIQRDGVSALTMEKIAEHTEYAKGTIYKHFSCKEDILCGLCLNCLGHMYQLFIQALSWPGNQREKMICIGVGYQLYTQQFPEEFDLLVSVRTNNIREKASSERMERMEQADSLVMNALRTIINQAISCGELTLPGRMTVDDMCFGLWSASFGLLVLDYTRDVVGGLDLSPSDELMFAQMSCLLDGYQWRPLSSERDYLPTYRAAHQQLQQLLSKD